RIILPQRADVTTTAPNVDVLHTQPHPAQQAVVPERGAENGTERTPAHVAQARVSSSQSASSSVGVASPATLVAAQTDDANLPPALAVKPGRGVGPRVPPAPRRQAEQDNTPAAVQPTIQVTIGRVEVRASPAPAAPPRKANTAPLLSLEEYLATR